MSETARIADQLLRAFQGAAWHGDSLLEILDGVTAAQACAHPIKHAHSIWELVLHIAAWDGAARRRMAGEAVVLSDDQNFPPVKDTSEGAWQRALENAKKAHSQLVEAVAAFPEARLNEKVPGKPKEADWHNFYYMLHGVVQHELYHAGQIALLKKAL
ncbi:MAG TPA: DinB family protein [Candidatus Eisenbacteria bacterium]|nr:DinB family protein [Candidatus Eisenbacteria bacterium]